MIAVLFALLAALAPSPALPPLPATDAALSIPAQESPWEPGPRSVELGIFYPGGALSNVTRDTGLFLTLHNWGGTGAIGAPAPGFLVENYNVVAITVDYYQSGKWTADGAQPYDFGFLQAGDALRALHFVYNGLQQKGIPFHKGRLYAAGGSGGGNVALMANKLAPRTLACVVDLSGMAKLNDDIAFGHKGGSKLDANYSRDPARPNYLSPARQEFHFIGHPEHLRQMKEMGNSAVIVVVHGADDDTCPVVDVQEMVDNMAKTGLRVDTHIVSGTQVDGKVFKDSRHSLGDRTLILDQVAGKYLRPDSPEAARQKQPNDFDLAAPVTFSTGEGRCTIDFASGPDISVSITPAQK